MILAKCKVKNQFYDKENNNELRKNGDEFICAFERAKYLNEHGVAEVIKVFDEKIEEDIKEDKEEEKEKPKRTRSKKKTI